VTVRLRLLAVLMPCLLLGAALGAEGNLPGVVLYVNRVVVAAPGDVSLGALVQASGTLPPGSQEELARSVTVLGDKVQYLPSKLYVPRIEAVFGSDAIIVGSRTILIPRGTSAEGESYLLDQLADFLSAQGLVDEGKVEISYTQGSLRGGPPRDGTPSCQVVKTPRGVEVSFTMSGSGGASVSGRITLPPAPAVMDLAGAVKPGAQVRVVFRKGPITVEMPGKVLTGSSVGETASVILPESQKTFSGRVVEGKVVQVDLP
jgi:hypothetical protein